MVEAATIYCPERNRMEQTFTPIPQAIEALREGRVLILVDDEERENEGDLVFAAELSTPEKINFLATHGRGLICAPATAERLERLGLRPPAVEENTALMGTNFTQSVDAIHGVTTGISAADRCATVRMLANPEVRPADLARPGHIFPIAAREGGVLARAGHTEGTVDLCRLAGLQPVGVLCEILRDDGQMARLPDLFQMAERFGLPVVTIKDIIAYRRRTERLINKVVTTNIPNAFGQWELSLYEDIVENGQHLAMTMGKIDDSPILVRMHSQCFTGDTIGSLRCDCGFQLEAAMGRVADEGRGIIVYLHQEGRGIGLKNKLLAYKLQDGGCDTVDANARLGFKPDLREYGIGAQILVDLGVRRIRLMTNNPRKIVGLEAYGLEIAEVVPLEAGRGEHNEHYLETKRIRLGHRLTKGRR